MKITQRIILMLALIVCMGAEAQVPEPPNPQGTVYLQWQEGGGKTDEIIKD